MRIYLEHDRTYRFRTNHKAELVIAGDDRKTSKIVTDWNGKQCSRSRARNDLKGNPRKDRNMTLLKVWESSDGGTGGMS